MLISADRIYRCGTFDDTHERRRRVTTHALAQDRAKRVDEALGGGGNPPSSSGER